MGKETKIGVSVILILLCVLAGTLAIRMTRNKDSALVAATPEIGKRPSPPPATPVEARRPETVVVPSSKPSGWAAASDVSSPASKEHHGPKGPPMSYMPDPARTVSRFSGSTSAPALGPTPGLAPGAVGSGATTLSVRPFAPGDRAAQTGPSFASSPPPPAPVPPEPNPLRMPSPGPAAGGSFGRYGSSSPPLAAPAPTPPPTYAANRYGPNSSLEASPAPIHSVSMANTIADAPHARRQVEGPPADGKYRVRPSDNYWHISERLYGSGAYFKALAEHNRDRIGRPDRLLPGTTLAAPSAKELEEKYPDLCPKPNHQRKPGSRFANVSSGARLAGRRTYKVESGDTLFDIAKHELGSPGRWGEIYELNRDVLGDDYDYLSPGLELVLPDAPRPDTLTRNPEGLLRR